MAHIHEKIDFTAETFVVYQNKVLLRFHDKYNIWLSVGGHIELHEDPNQAAVREVKEEVGLDVVLWEGNRFLRGDESNIQLIPPVTLSRHRINEMHEHVSMSFIARTTSDKVVIENEGDRSDRWGWFTRDELQTLELRPDVKKMAEFALEKLGS